MPEILDRLGDRFLECVLPHRSRDEAQLSAVAASIIVLANSQPGSVQVSNSGVA
jgi:hypothetical protein